MTHGSRAATHRSRLRLNKDRLADASTVLGGLLALATALAFLAQAWWAFDLFSHFRVQYLAGAVFLALVLVVLKRRRAALLPLVVAIVNLWFVVPLYVRGTAAAPVAAGTAVRIMSINVFGYNDEYRRVIENVRREQPDVLIVLEVTPEWAIALRELYSEYQYRWVHPGDLRSGIAVFSRHPPQGASELDLGGTGDPSLLLTLPVQGGSLSVLGVHLYWPLGQYVSAIRNRQMESIARLAREHDGPLVIAGDLNATVFSAHYRRMLREGGLRDCAKGRGLLPTWPARMPFLFIRIDHCLATGSVGVKDFRVGDYVGSDHYPILMDVAAAP